MNASASGCLATDSNDKSGKFLFQNDNVTQGAVRRYLLRPLFTSVLCVVVGCALDRNPVPLDLFSFSDSDGSADQGSVDDASPSGREYQRDSGDTSTPDRATPDGAGESGASVDEASLSDASTPDAAIVGEASITDTSTGDEPKEDAAPPGEDAEEPTDCDLRGIYGGQVTVEAWWGGRSEWGGLVALVDAGRATLLLNIMYFIKSVESDGTIVASAKTCNIELPSFYTSIICEAYQPVFPVRVWDSPANPSFTVTGNATCTKPGCTVHTDTLPALLGVKLDDPFGDWPDASETPDLSCEEGTGSDCFPDHDDDGYPGITVDLLTEGKPPLSSGCLKLGIFPAEIEYRAAPLAADPNIIVDNPVSRTDRIHLGTRAMIGGDAVIANDCRTLKGAAVADGFQSRAISCFLQQGVPTGAPDGGVAGSNTYCRREQREFMDNNLPLYNCMKQGDVPPADLTAITNRTPSNGPRMSLVKLGNIGDDITCEDVRKATY